ncbi:hypothetical protein GM3709_3252 [Geminocystis sp. NIES-3709]|nr:hypothetical protein GM3709_3252 [Geminocystis sp. NIES-3709]
MLDKAIAFGGTARSHLTSIRYGNILEFKIMNQKGNYLRQVN